MKKPSLWGCDDRRKVLVVSRSELKRKRAKERVKNSGGKPQRDKESKECGMKKKSKCKGMAYAYRDRSLFAINE
jgi:ribosomal protein L20